MGLYNGATDQYITWNYIMELTTDTINELYNGANGRYDQWNYIMELTGARMY